MRYFLLSAMLTVGAVSVAVGQLSAAPPERGPATINVTLPTDAQMTIDGQATRSTSGHRLFITPPLEAGQDFWYTLTARFVREDQTITVEQRVWVRAGRETVVSLDLPGAVFAHSELPNGYRYDYGAESDTGSYSSARERPGSAAGRLRRSPATRSEDWSSSPGLNPTHWGSDPSDPFYHHGDW